MAESYTIHFVTWPDGKVDGTSLNVHSQQIAKSRLIGSWLPEHVFGKSGWLESNYTLGLLWTGMQEKGQLYTLRPIITVDATGCGCRRFGCFR